MALPASNSLIAAGTAASCITYVCTNDGTGSAHIRQATNVAGYYSWGCHTALGLDYATSGQVAFFGNIRWYIIETYESYNGMRLNQFTGQANFLQWFSPCAFGGAAYANTPVGAVSHTDEPHLDWCNDLASYFGLWAKGKNFAICAWVSRNTGNFQAVGDPLVRR
jgi:hypothetical protein